VYFVFLMLAAAWTAPASAQSVTVAWDPSPDPSVVGYIVYAGTQSGEYTAEFNVGAAISFVYGVAPETPYFFAVASYDEGLLVGSISDEVVGIAQASVLLSRPGDQWTTVGNPAELQLFGMDSSGNAVTYDATNLPPGIAIDSSSGLVYGTPDTMGTYQVTVTASNGVATATQTFTWTIMTSGVDTTPPVVTITMPADRVLTGDSAYLVGGVATDDGSIVEVTWANSRGGSGTASGTDTWIAAIPLHIGRNDITITAVDEGGNYGTSMVSIRQTWSP
jgi:hypothetical protein